MATVGSAAARPEPPRTITNSPRDFGPGAYFTDPDVLAVDPAFEPYIVPNCAIRRLWTGALWAEGPAWNSVGRFVVWSDIPNNRQMRWLEEDGHVSTFRAPSNNSNGNSFDRQGRQLSPEHAARRVVRYELDGSAMVLADGFDGKPLNERTTSSSTRTGPAGSPIRPTLPSSTRACRTRRAAPRIRWASEPAAGAAGGSHDGATVPAARRLSGRPLQICSRTGPA